MVTRLKPIRVKSNNNWTDWDKLWFLSNEKFNWSNWWLVNYLTQAEYDALPESKKSDWNTYLICFPDWLSFTDNATGSTLQLTSHNHSSTSPIPVELEISWTWVNWEDYEIWDVINLDNYWWRIFMRNKSETVTWFWNNYAYYQFVMTWSISASWDCNYLLCKNSTLYLTFWLTHTFYNLFKDCISLTSMPKLPATSLFKNDYESMFSWCTNLVYVTDLVCPALEWESYKNMFNWCTRLTTPPRIFATRCWPSSCLYMFNWCTNLTTLPKLYFNNIPWYWCAYMFLWCTKIKVSATQTWDYQNAYSIPSSSTTEDPTYAMFRGTGGTFTSPWTPTPWQTYYTSNNII